MNDMEGELKNFIMVWTIAAATMCYCHTIVKFIPHGKSRLVAIFPAILILLLLPLRLISIHLGGPTSFFLGWLSTFKLLLFALGKGPLSSNPPLPLSHFVPLSLLPIKLFQTQHQSNLSNTQNTPTNLRSDKTDVDNLTINNKYISRNTQNTHINLRSDKVDIDNLTIDNKDISRNTQNTHINLRSDKADVDNLTIDNKDVSRNTQNSQITKKGHKLPLNYTFATMVFVLAFLIPLYAKKENLHPKFTLFLYSLHLYIGLEFIFGITSILTRKLHGLELEPQFNEPYLCTSLQDFWGRRWNLMVNRILHPTIYEPMVNASTRAIGRKWASLLAIVATFTVSGLMHELVFYYIKREKRTWETWEPSWDSMCFFLIHGVCLASEVALKKALKGKWQLPRLVSWLLTVVFVFYTALWLFVPALVRCHVYEKGSRELNVIAELCKDFYGLLRKHKW
ncbi:hypothetical protein Lal_00043876 [Lupinus albus]|uniref:Putative long-chain-alcohol O-fatty-acyltransferase n=1 Tax=Lupinus albus TaxID=3870 RepID=A0A6A5PEV1_LUPAL|nr:putative long-chain-alcohol O-fatty-acyltransferase [Lupinus albus]KAF1895231.1 hypothetical protein Lal_00043876 [Lupinus albus]